MTFHHFILLPRFNSCGTGRISTAFSAMAPATGTRRHKSDTTDTMAAANEPRRIASYKDFMKKQ